ncbi:acyl-CoA dehydrogenase [Saccharopolyspora aridisoli]|uniref:Acyl-CoA dehydrogenase n=1 Tax=Saccharopolyspora aridisoli TaxID=2530385 RepID=A0A4R4UDF0_9PSEU|nr:acyl-CoA dehydrogenase family protein [Saccharopolyspora aridisoli]TDC89330.1 acyl-CoA dehydrogenase [Saccharopolyspora aridisoli]
MTDLLYTEVEEDLRSGVRRVLRDRCDWTAVLARVETDEPYHLELWRSLAGEMGLAGLLVPEELGGAGATARELSVVAEEIGRAVAPVPFLGTVLATAALAGCAERTALPQLVDGSMVGTLAVGLTTVPHASFPQSVKAENSTLTGTVSAVVDLEVADYAVVPAVDTDGSALYLVETSAATRTSATPLDLTRRFGALVLDGTAGERIASGAEAERVLRHALLTAAGMLAAEQVGLAQHCLDTTVEYAKTRYQFGRQIGSFQAIKHRLADLWTKISMARTVSRNASDALAAGTDEELAVAMAQASVSDLVVHAAEEHLQLHGGIGMTWEHPAHLYLGRAKSTQLTFGIAEAHRARIAELVDLPGGSA